MSHDRKRALSVVVGEDLHPAHIERLRKISEAHTKEVLRKRIIYPDPNKLDLDSSDAEYSVTKHGFLSNSLGIKQRKGKKGSGKGKPKLPDPRVVAAEVQKTFAGIPLATASANLMIGEFNGEFLDASKARYFEEAYREVGSRLHFLGLEEIDQGGLDYLANALQYDGFCSVANTRGQAVAALVNPARLTVLRTTEYPQIGSVQGVPDLRPALRIDVRDRMTHEEFGIVVVHLKSMRGGPQVTAAIRYKQLDILQNLLGPSFKGIVLGDFNFILNDRTLKDGDPLLKNGYTLVAAKDATGTHTMGSRIDGFFLKDMALPVGFYQVRAYFRNPNITRAFSDHALVNVQVVNCQAAAQMGNTSNPGCPGGPVEGSYPVDVVPALLGRGGGIRLMPFSHHDDDGNEVDDFDPDDFDDETDVD